MRPGPRPRSRTSEAVRAREALGATIIAASEALRRPHAVREDGWYGVTGDETTGLALALAHGSPAGVTATVGVLEDTGLPALLALAGEARAHRSALPPGWQRIARVPIMVRDLVGPSTDLPDPRVRPAASGDLPEVTDVVVSTSGVSPWSALLVTTPVTCGDGGPVQAWVLEEDGEVVSTVVAGRVGATVTLWSVATPPERARRGHGRALLASVLADARAEGATYGVLAATPRSRRWYGAGGWRTVEEWELHTHRARP